MFDIDIEEGVVLKLPYNLNTDAWFAAQDFIHKHDLPQGHLDTIANFIMKNSDQTKVSVASSGSVDPFTGGGAYNSGAGGGDRRLGSNGFSGDPLTSNGAYTSSNGGGMNSSTAMDVDAVNLHFPQKEFFSFAQAPKFEALTKKMKEFNQSVSAEQKLTDDEIDRLPQLCTPGQSPQNEDIPNLMRALGWPAKFSFPALDILRLAILNPKASALLLDGEIIDKLFSLLLLNINASALDNCQMLAMKTLANMFCSERGNLIESKHKQV